MNAPSRVMRLKIRRCQRALLGALALASLPASAQLSVSVAPDPLPLGGAAILSFSLAGDTDSVRSGIAFSVDLPAGLAVTSPALNSLDCPGSLSAMPGGSRIEVSGVSQAVAQDCEARVYVGATATGTFSIVTSEVIQAGGPPLDAALADLDVVDDRPALTLSYSDASARWRERMTLTYTLESRAPTSVSGIAIEDRLPPGWAFAADSSPQASCSDGSPGTVTAAGRELRVVNGFLFSDDSTCSYTLPVIAGSVGLQAHAASMSAARVPTHYALAAVDVRADDLHLSHAFDGTGVPGDVVELAYTVRNTSAGDASGIAFSHDLDAVLSGLVVAGAPVVEGCGAGASVTGDALVSFSGGDIATGQTCSVALPVAVPAGAPVGDYVSATSVVTATLGGAAYAAPSASVSTLAVASLPTMTRLFLTDTVTSDDTVVLEYTLENTSSDSALSDFSFTDDYSSVARDIVSLPSPGACGAGSSFFRITSGGGNDLGASSLSLAPRASCSFFVGLSPFASAGNVELAPLTAEGSIDGGVRRARVSGDSLRVLGAPPVQLSLSAPRVGAGGSSQLEVSVGNPDAVVDRDVPPPAYSALSWELDLGNAPLGIAGALPPDGVCGPGSQLSLAGQQLTLSGASIAAGETCDIALDLAVASDAAAGDYVLVLAGLSASQEGFSISGVDRSVTLAVDALAVEIDTSLQPAAPGDSLAIEVAFANPSAATELFDVSGTLDLRALVPGIAVDAVTVDNAACPTLTASNASGADVVFDIQTLGADVQLGCRFSVEVSLSAGLDPGDYPLRVQGGSVTYGDATATPTSFAVPQEILSVVSPGEPRDLSPLALSEPNPDGDGASTMQEEAIGDGNSDGLPDALQDAVASGFAADGLSAISVAVPPGTATVSAFSTQMTPDEAPADVVFPYGFVAFEISGVEPGNTQTVEVHMPFNPDIDSYWKQDRDGEWTNVAASVAHNEADGRTVVTLQLVEGGPFDIESPNVPDTLTDPGGPGILPEPPRAIPVLPPLVLFLMVLSLAVLVQRSSERR